MRADVKFGIVLSMVVVFVAGGYYLYRDHQELPIPLTDASRAINKKAPGSSLVQTQSAMRENAQPQIAKRKNTPVETPANRTAQDKNIPARNNFAGNKTGSQVARKNNSPKNPGIAKQNGLNGPTQTTNRQNPNASKANVAGANQPAPLNGKMRPLQDQTADQSNKQLTQNPDAAQNQSRSLIAKNIPTVAMETHRVQPGDSFSSLAKMYYGHERHTQFLMSQNPQITNPNALKVGAVIKIPPAPTQQQEMQSAVSNPGTKQTSSKVYVVRSGDSFYRIAEQQLGDSTRWEELFNLNKAVVKGDPKRLKPGQKIVLP